MFPFDQPWPSAAYATLLAVTFGLHFAAAAFVLGGSGWVAIAQLLRPGRSHPVTDILVDWMPFAMGATITLGVAPLLFVQIVDQEGFYTANLLLFHRWMAMLPILILAFYMLYLLKGAPRLRQHVLGGRVVPLLVFAATAFVALSWSENHLLSLDRGAWVDLYREGAMRFATPELWPRFALACASSAVGLAAVLANAKGGRARGRTLGTVALAGLIATAAAGTWLARAGHASAMPPIAWVAAAGALFGAATASVVAARGRLALAAWIAAAIALGFVREALRSARLGDALPAERHRAAAEHSGGLWLFALIAMILLAVAVPLVRAVRRDLVRSDRARTMGEPR